jgi:hypothetical protein
LAGTAALGLRAHSGWAAAVAIAGSADYPRLLDRRIIQLADPQIPGSKQPYHAAATLDPKAAEQLIQKCTESTHCLAVTGLTALVDDLHERKFRIAGCGLLLGAGRPLPPLAGILASHALIHTAEGEFFRAGLAEAGKISNLAVIRVKEKELYTCAARDLGLPSKRIEKYLKDLGHTAGPPWREDQKCAVLAAWLALIAAGKATG